MHHLQRLRTPILAIIVVAMTIVGGVVFLFGWPPPPDPATLQEIEYRFEDASVPPEYHRSYTIAITPQAATIAVDSYGDILLEESYPITEMQFRDIAQSLVSNNIRSVVRRGIDAECVGGTSETVAYADASRELFRARVYHCGGSDSGALGGNVESFGEDVRGLIPDFDDLLNVSV